MNGLMRLIDFRGHAKRGEYWAISVSANVISWIFAAIAGVAPQSPLAGLLVLVVTFFVVLPVHAAATVRRLHDRGKSGWWALLFLGVPLVVGLFAPFLRKLDGGAPPFLVVALIGFLAVLAWAFVELGVLEGKTKGNRYLNAANPKLVAVFD